MALLLVPVAVSAQTGGAKGLLPTQRVLAPYGLERMWWNQAVMNPSRDVVAQMVADEEVLVVQSRAGITTVFDAETGRKLWARRLGRQDAPAFPAVTNDEMVMVAIGTEIHALAKMTGAEIWTFRLPSAPSTSPELDDRHVYIGARDGSVYAFDLRKIKRFYKEGLLPQWSYQTMAWRYKAFKEVTTRPISTGRVLNFASRGGSLYSVSTKDRKLVFQFETDRPISAPMAWNKRALYLPSEDFKVYCVDMENGDTKWTYNTGLAVRQAPRLVGDDLYILPTRGGIHDVDAATGKRKWWRPKISQFVAASLNTLYVSDQLGNLIMLRREDGAVLGALPFRSFSVRMANDRTDRIYIARPSGLIACIREKGRDYPLYLKYPDRRPILPELTKEPPAPPAAKLNP